MLSSAHCPPLKMRTHWHIFRFRRLIRGNTCCKFRACQALENSATHLEQFQTLLRRFRIKCSRRHTDLHRFQTIVLNDWAEYVRHVGIELDLLPSARVHKNREQNALWVCARRGSAKCYVYFSLSKERVRVAACMCNEWVHKNAKVHRLCFLIINKYASPRPPTGTFAVWLLHEHVFKLIKCV